MKDLRLYQDGEPSARGVPVPSSGLRIGRDPGNDLRLPDPQVSRRHARVWQDGGRYYVRDESSTNGTFVNEERIAGTRELKLGDRIRVGSSIFELRAGTGAQAPAHGVRSFIAIVLGVGLVGVFLLASLWTLRAEEAQVATIASPTLPPIVEVVTPTWTPSPSRAEEATVVLKVPLDYEPGVFSVGSGSIVDPKGLILTNFHVVGDEETGGLYNSAGQTYVGITTMPDGQASWRYQAKPVVWDLELDLAVLEIVSDTDGHPITSPLSLPTATIGDSDDLLIGQTISILGYPDVGLDTLTVTKGTVAGFVLDENNRRLWIKTDAAISLGNSGGLAMTEAGELIGVPTRALTSVGQLGYVRPINWALVLLEQAR
jgi:S1-C subfamily serine protease